VPAVKRPLPPGCFKDETPATPDAAIWSCRPTQLALSTNAVLGGVVRSSGYVVPNALSDESVALQSDFSVVYINLGPEAINSARLYLHTDVYRPV